MSLRCLKLFRQIYGRSLVCNNNRMQMSSSTIDLERWNVSRSEQKKHTNETLCERMLGRTKLTCLSTLIDT